MIERGRAFFSMKPTQRIVLVVLAIVTAIGSYGMWRGRVQRNTRLRAETYAIGHDLLTTTNSSRLEHVMWSLQQKLHGFLDTNSGIAQVLIGDDAFAGGNVTAATRLFLTNSRQECLRIRLRETVQKRFSIVGFATTAPPTAQTNR